jgi:hypothetical protein
VFCLVLVLIWMRLCVSRKFDDAQTTKNPRQATAKMANILPCTTASSMATRNQVRTSGVPWEAHSCHLSSTLVPSLVVTLPLFGITLREMMMMKHTRIEQQSSC